MSRLVFDFTEAGNLDCVLEVKRPSVFRYGVDFFLVLWDHRFFDGPLNLYIVTN